MSVWRYNVYTEQYQQTNTWFFNDENHSFTAETEQLSENSDDFSYITQDFSESENDERITPFSSWFYHFELRCSAPAA